MPGLHQVVLIGIQNKGEVMSSFEKMIKESFDSHLKSARRILRERKEKEEKFNKFLFLDFDSTLYDNESQSIIEGDAYNKLVESVTDPEPCYIAIVTARRSDTKDFVKSKVTDSIEDLLEDFKGVFSIETVLDKSAESKPSIYETASLKADCISNIISDNVENLQDIIVHFYDDTEENVEEVSKALDFLNISSDNCYIV